MSLRLPSEDTLARQSDVTVSTNVTLYAEYKGFFIYVISAVILSCWVGWAVLPDYFIRDYLSINYYPDKYWSYAIPSYFLLLMLFGYVSFALYNTEVKTLALDDVRNFVDEHSNFIQTREEVNSTPLGVWDVPVTLVNEVLYGNNEQQ